MKNEILASLDDPAQLERLYRADKSAFRRAFNALYPELADNRLASFWHTRLNFSREEISWGARKELVFVIMASLIAGLIAKLPAILHLDQEYFYTRNIGFILFPALSAWFAWKNKLQAGKIAVLLATTLAGVLFINLLPTTVDRSDTLLLSCIHLLVFLWAITGFAFAGRDSNNVDKRLNFLSYNGDLIVMTTLIVIAGAILSSVTVGLFSLIGLNIELFYFENIVPFGLPAAPILGTYLTQTNPQLVGKVSPVIAKIFSPLVLIMLVFYLIAIVYSGQDPYNDREFLMIFNALLIGVMAIIFFSVAESSRSGKSQPEVWVLFLLSVLTVVVNGIALSAILFRISEWGMTPNRAAVLGANVLMGVNLVLVSVQLFKVLAGFSGLTQVRKGIGLYLPVYILWAMVVTFLFPFIFGYK